MKTYLTLLLAAAIFASCQPATPPDAPDEATETVENAPAPGFNAAASDERAMQLADQVMQAMGGRTAWDTTRYFQWNFLGFRTLLWDKQTGDVRIEVPGDSAIYAVNVRENTGKVRLKGQEITQPDSLAKYVQQGKEIWINDSYWLFMPFKLKDSGVTLTYHGEDTLMGGAPAEVLELRFEEVGVTPQNKYRVFVDPEDHLVKQWAYYPEAAMDTPRFVLPWNGYQTYGSLKLGGDRGERNISNIQVLDTVPTSAFQDVSAFTLGDA
ncbi:MAG: hypothetical protein WA958_00790 [Tunicatimonas sp.]